MATAFWFITSNHYCVTYTFIVQNIRSFELVSDMSAQILDGVKIANAIRRRVAKEALELCTTHSVKLGLTVILVGTDPASELYVKLKKRDCVQAGINCDVLKLPASIKQSQLIDEIEKLNVEPNVHGILLQLPLPSHLHTPDIVNCIDPVKDVDGITPLNVGKLTLREPSHRCCTPKGVITLLEHTDVRLLGADAVVVGASNHVGRPMCLELLLRGSSVTVVHKYSKNSQTHTRNADILVSATGVAGLIKRDWVKPGAVVIDVGIETQGDGSLKGDVEFDEVQQVASWITPVPGGVGPMTRVSLLQNLLDAARLILN